MLKIVYKNKYITYKLICEIGLFHIKLQHRIFEVIYLTQIYLFFFIIHELAHIVFSV